MNKYSNQLQPILSKHILLEFYNQFMDLWERYYCNCLYFTGTVMLLWSFQNQSITTLTECQLTHFYEFSWGIQCNSHFISWSKLRTEIMPVLVKLNDLKKKPQNQTKPQNKPHWSCWFSFPGWKVLWKKFHNNLLWTLPPSAYHTTTRQFAGSCSANLPVADYSVFCRYSTIHCSEWVI